MNTVSNQLLIICGPTATGKTSFGLDMARKLGGEIISADSRQVYQGMDIVTGKDLPQNATPIISHLKWRDRFLKYYLVEGIKIWLYDIVRPSETFNVSFWHDCAQLVIPDILSRGHLPILVGGTGLYFKSITHNLSLISIPPNLQLRQKLVHQTSDYLFNYLNQINPNIAADLNNSDKHNPRRLIRAIEISLSPPPQKSIPQSLYQSLSIGLTAPFFVLKARVDERVSQRVLKGAMEETTKLVAEYSPRLPSFTACGYQALLSADPLPGWQSTEHRYLRRQLTWFKRQPSIIWFDISKVGWQEKAEKTVLQWYN